MAATDEKDLPASQSQTQTDPRIPRPNGDARRAQGAQKAPRQGTASPRRNHPAQTAGLGEKPARGFGAADRLHRRAEFLRVQRKGVRAQSGHFVVYAARLAIKSRNCLGVTVSRRIGNAVVRNRVKRRIRECFRLQLREQLPEGIAMVVIALAGAGAMDSPSINAELGAATLSLAERLRSSHQ